MAVSTSCSNKLKDEVYKAAVYHAGKNDDEKNKEIILKFYEENPTSPIDDQGDTVLHVLALHCTKVACELLKLEMHHGLLAKNCKGNTALHEAARVGALEIAELMVHKENSIVDHSNLVGETPLYWAAAYGQTEMFQFLAEKSNHSNLMGLRRNDGLTILHAAVMGEFYDLAKEIVDRYPPFLAVACNEEKKTALHLLAQSPFLFRSGTLYSEMNVADSSFIPLALLKLMIYNCLSIPVEDPNKGNLTDPEDSRKPEDGRSFVRGKKRMPGTAFLQEIKDTKKKHILVRELVQLLVKRESEYSKWNKSISDGGELAVILGPLREHPIFLRNTNTMNNTLALAARNGIVEIVDVILEECPWAIEFVDENGKNILHLAAEYRQVGIFKLLKSRGILITKMAADVDNQGNTALHLAAKYQKNLYYATGNDMAWEYLWFKRVKKISPAHISHLRNSEGRTAEEIFNDTHEKLLLDGAEWAKKTTGNFMVISTLIATVNFNAAFAVPGGYNQDSGIPIFATKAKDLPAFYAYSTVALFFSVVTLGSSFSGFLSRFHSLDFYFFLPLKHFLGGSSLFYSTFYTVLAYVQALTLVTYGQTTTLEGLVGCFAAVVAIVTINLIFIDIMFPAFRYMFSLLIHRIPCLDQWM